MVPPRGLEAVEVLQGLIQGGMDLDVLLFGSGQSLYKKHTQKGKSADKTQNLVSIQRDIKYKGTPTYPCWQEQNMQAVMC